MTTEPAGAPDHVGRILAVLEECLAEDVPSARNGEDLARRAHLSRFHLDRLVSAALGEAPAALRRRLLLERAAHQLASTGATVLAVATAAGFESPEGFARAFARAYGCSPSRYRAAGPDRPAPARAASNQIHFHPPAGLRVPVARSSPVDVLTRMAEHHLATVAQILDRLDRVDPAVLDAPVTLSVDGIDDDPSLRGLADRLVGQLEMWVATIDGATALPAAGDATPDGLRARLADVAPRFRDAVVRPVAEGRGDETFIDAVCDPAETFTLGGVLAHVLTFAAVRRTMAIGALESAGVGDLGAGDPMHAVGGTGSDASGITRRTG